MGDLSQRLQTLAAETAGRGVEGAGQMVDLANQGIGALTTLPPKLTGYMTGTGPDPRLPPAPMPPSAAAGARQAFGLSPQEQLPTWPQRAGAMAWQALGPGLGMGAAGKVAESAVGLGERGALGKPLHVPEGVDIEGTAVKTAKGRPTRVYRGTTATYEEEDPSTWTEGLYGPGHYYSESPVIAGGRTKGALVKHQEFGYATGQGEVVDIDRRIAQMRDKVYRYSNDVESLKEMGKGEYDMDLMAYNGYLNNAREELARLEGGEIRERPQVRAGYLNIRNPLRIEERVPQEELSRVRDDFQKLLGQLKGQLSAENVIFGSRLRWHLDNMHPSYTGKNLYDALTDIYGDKTTTNEVLQELGYDGITHIAGRGDRAPHRVWIAFDPEQFVPAWVGRPTK